MIKKKLFIISLILAGFNCFSEYKVNLDKESDNIEITLCGPETKDKTYTLATSKVIVTEEYSGIGFIETKNIELKLGKNLLTNTDNFLTTDQLLFTINKENYVSNTHLSYTKGQSYILLLTDNGPFFDKDKRFTLKRFDIKNEVKCALAFYYQIKSIDALISIQSYNDEASKKHADNKAKFFEQKALTIDSILLRDAIKQCQSYITETDELSILKFMRHFYILKYLNGFGEYSVGFKTLSECLGPKISVVQNKKRPFYLLSEEEINELRFFDLLKVN